MAYYKKIYNEKFGVWYPSAVVMGSPVSTKKLARRLSQMCTVTYADVMAVLGELPGVMADYMSQGKSVRLEGLGTFRYTLKTNGVADEAYFDFQKQVEAARVQSVPQREGAVTRGGPASRELVPAGSEWLPYDAATSAGSNTQEPGTGEEEGDGNEGSFG